MFKLYSTLIISIAAVICVNGYGMAEEASFSGKLNSKASLLQLSLSPEEQHLLQAVNDIRRAAGVEKCRIDPSAQKAATAYAEQIGEQDRFSHVDATGRRGIDRYRNSGGLALRVGEILGTGKAIDRIIGAWKRSPEHAAVIRSAEWTHVGAGAAEAPSGGVVAVLLFTRRVFGEIHIDIHRQNGKIIITGTLFRGGLPEEGHAAVVINGTLMPIDTADDGRFTIYYPEQHAVYFLRFGIFDTGAFSATESLIFDPGSS